MYNTLSLLSETFILFAVIDNRDASILVPVFALMCVSEADRKYDVVVR